MYLNFEHGELYWLFVDGPDGYQTLIGRYCSRTNTFDLFDDGRTAWLENDGTIHKWKINDYLIIERPLLY